MKKSEFEKLKEGDIVILNGRCRNNSGIKCVVTYIFRDEEERYCRINVKPADEAKKNLVLSVEPLQIGTKFHISRLTYCNPKRGLTRSLCFRENYKAYYGRKCIIRNLIKIKSVEFGTVGPRPTLSLLFLFAFITKSFMKPKQVYIYILGG